MLLSFLKVNFKIILPILTLLGIRGLLIYPLSSKGSWMGISKWEKKLYKVILAEDTTSIIKLRNKVQENIFYLEFVCIYCTGLLAKLSEFLPWNTGTIKLFLSQIGSVVPCLGILSVLCKLLITFSVL